MNVQTQAAGRGAVLLLSPDATLITALRPAFTALGLSLIPVDGLTDLIRALGKSLPLGMMDAPVRLVLVDARSLSGAADLVPVALQLQPRQGQGPALVCLTQGEDIRFRLAAMRAGAAACLPSDTDSGELADRVAALAGLPSARPPRVLVVDDQPVAALFACRVLEGAGMQVEAVGDPLKVLDALARFAPGLILMDLHMPSASGIELTRIIREQVRYLDLPIVFLSAELDPGRQLEALRIGGDDFLAKPVSPDRLVACVNQRLALARQRASLQRAAAQTDPETGLASRDRLLAHLERQLAGGEGRGALLYLEPASDFADLASLAAAVAHCAGPDDLVARAGGQGIAVLARRPGSDAIGAFAEALGQRVRARLEPPGAAAQAPLVGIGWCAVSAGGGDALTLVSRARAAARRSLRRGAGQAEGYVRAPDRPLTAAQRDPVLKLIRDRQFQLLFQPLLALRHTQRARYEATLRLRTGEGELLAPDSFLPLALRAGLTADIDRWVLVAGLDILASRRAAGHPVGLFLGQSVTSTADAAWPGWLRDEINARDLIQTPPILVFQIADADRNLDLAARRAADLGRLGIRLCLDGLVPGEPGERVVERLPTAFVRLGAEASRPAGLAALKSLIDLIHQRRGWVIANGVDGPESIAGLYRQSVDLIQGPYVQPPAESMDFDFSETESAG